MLKRTNIYLSEIQVNKLQQLAVNTGLSVAELIRRAVDIFLKAEGVTDCSNNLTEEIRFD